MRREATVSGCPTMDCGAVGFPTMAFAGDSVRLTADAVKMLHVPVCAVRKVTVTSFRSVSTMVSGQSSLFAGSKHSTKTFALPKLCGMTHVVDAGDWCQTKTCEERMLEASDGGLMSGGRMSRFTLVPVMLKSDDDCCWPLKR